MKHTSPRSGFTLIELLVSVTILIILAVIVVTTVHVSTKADPPEEARAVASFIEGARDRAIFARQPVGVRLQLDPLGPTNSAGNPTTATSLTYIKALEKFTVSVSIGDDPATTQTDYRRIYFWSPGPDGQPGVAGMDDDNDMTADEFDEFLLDVGGDEYTGDQWDFHEQKGFLNPRGTRVEFVVNGQKLWSIAVKQNGYWVMTKDFPSSVPATRMDVKMTVQPPIAAVMPNQKDRELARGVCIDLETSRIANRIPGSWYNMTTQSYSTCDIMFDGNGRMMSEIDGVLSLNLIVAFAADVEQTTHTPAMFYNLSTRPNRDKERIVSIGMATGKIHSAPINTADQNGNDVPDDPFLFAETGR